MPYNDVLAIMLHLFMEMASFHLKWPMGGCKKNKLSNTHLPLGSSLAAVTFPGKGKKGEEPSHMKGVRKCWTKPWKAHLRSQKAVGKEAASFYLSLSAVTCRASLWLEVNLGISHIIHFLLVRCLLCNLAVSLVLGPTVFLVAASYCTLS